VNEREVHKNRLNPLYLFLAAGAVALRSILFVKETFKR